MPDDSTTALVLDAQRGDVRAQDRLIAHYLPLVYNVAGRALGGGHADVDDIVQDTFIRALSHLGQLREPECFRAWLVTITTNRIRDHWRAVQAAAAATREPIDEDTEPAEAGSDFADLTILHLGLTGQRAEVAEATRWMDEEDRTLLSLWWLEAAGQLSRVEVAEALGLSPQHTAVRVQRMKERLEASRALVRALAQRPRCTLLDELTGRWDGVPSALWRKRLSRHISTCADCQARSRGLVPAEGLLMGLALVPAMAGLLRLLRHESPTAVLAAAAHTPADGTPSTASEASGASQATEVRTPLTRRGSASSRKPGGAPRLRTPLVATALVLLIGAGATILGTRAPAPALSAAVSPAPAQSSLPAPPQIGDAASATADPQPSATPSATPTAAASPTRTPTRSATPTARPTPRPRTVTERMLDLINQERARAGCTPVRPERRLTTAAQEHSDDMAARDYFSHTNPEGLDSGDRIAAAGYDADGYNENIGDGYDSPESVMKAWMSGGGHREAILDCNHKDAGIGYATSTDDDSLWTLLLAHR
ncbi:sigma-70 family RNA polymerase sigma factor [Streptomyces goshikiensis]|uniref:sigma-70 family RNA polymerase sigma factor n=1 Tax=Streptomyces goshikiensis TaxID=1942 RepID=UPI0038089017